MSKNPSCNCVPGGPLTCVYCIVKAIGKAPPASPSCTCNGSGISMCSVCFLQAFGAKHLSSYKTMPTIKAQYGTYGTQFNNQFAYSLAAQNNWDVVIPKYNELQIDIDSALQLQQYYINKISYERNIAKIDQEVVQQSKSGNSAKKHIYLRINAQVTNIDRISHQLMLASDPVREMLSWTRHFNGEQYPTLFFELQGAGPPGFGIINPHHIPLPATVTIPPAWTLNVPVTPPSTGAIKWHFAQQTQMQQQQAAQQQQSDVSTDDPALWPHQCDRCGGPAYNGLFKSDCKNKCH